MIVDEQDYGIQFFLTPIRCRETHKLFPGVEAGDLGAKMGYHAKDNGYMLFNNYRIPRTNLLSRYCKLDREGKFTLEGDPRMLFAVMLSMRCWIVCVVWRFAAQASMIAGRYSVTRRQFVSYKDKKKESKLLDY